MVETTLNVAFYVVPILIAGLASYIARNKTWPVHFVVWVLGLPVMLVFGPPLVTFLAFQLFGIDLFE